MIRQLLLQDFDRLSITVLQVLNIPQFRITDYESCTVNIRNVPELKHGSGSRRAAYCQVCRKTDSVCFVYLPD
eukprot:c10554_g1_i1 orf=131-349(+)